MTKNLRNRLIIGLLLLILSTILAIFAHFMAYFPGDIAAARFVQNLSSQFVTSFMTLVSQGFTGIPAVVLVIACVVIVWWRLGRLEGLFMTIDGLLSPLALLFKLIIEQPRPPASLVDIITPASGLGFPSGHAFFAAMILGMLIYFVIKYVSLRPLKQWLIAALVFIILLVGFSRIYLGDHWASEVIASYVDASGFLMLLTVLYELKKGSKEGRQKAHETK